MKITKFILFALILLIGCEKVSTDYRDKYLGNWFFSIEKIKFSGIDSSSNFSEHDTVFYTGKISYGGGKNEINIQYTESESITLTTDESGKISGFPNHYCRGEFEGVNKINLYLRRGGLGGYLTHIVEGVKK